MRLRYLLAGLLLAVASPAAFGQKTTYVDHVLPLFKDKCVNCHNIDRMSGGLVLDNYTSLLEGGASGEVIKPGDPDGSKLLLTITHKVQPFMPPKAPPLPAEFTNVVRKWIADGALESAGSKGPTVKKPTTEIGLAAVVRGRPSGPPPMPSAPLRLDPVVHTTRANAVIALAANPWSSLVAVGGQKQVLLYNADTLELLGVLPFEEGLPTVLRFSRNGGLLLAAGGQGGKSGKAAVWDVRTGKRILTLGDEHDAILAADISADQTQIAVGGPSKVVRIYSTKDGSVLNEIRKHTDWVTAVEFSPDGVLLATGDRNGGLHVWEAFTAREFFTLRGHTGTIWSLSWRADSNVLASASEDTTVRLWEMQNGGQIKSWGAHGGGTQSVNYGQDGRITSAGRDRVVKLWDGNGGQQKAFDAFGDVALSAVLTHDSSRVVAGDWTGEIRVWTTADGKLQGKLDANPAPVAARLELAVKELTAKQAALAQATAAAQASQANAQKAAAALAAAQKAVTDTANAVKTATENAAKAKTTVDQSAAAPVTAQKTLTARDVVAKAQAEAAAKVKAAADAAKDNPELAASAAKVQALSQQATTELAAAQKAVTDADTASKQAVAQMTAAQQALTAAQAAMAAAPKQVEAATAANKAAADKAAADNAVVAQATAAVQSAQAAVDRLKAVPVASSKPDGK